MQPKSHAIRYDNVKSAVAEEGVLGLILREGAMMQETGSLQPEEFSCELLGRVFRQLRERFQNGLELSAGVLEDLNPEEMSHVAGILQRQQGPVNADAMKDFVRTIQTEHASGSVRSDDDLMALRNKMKERKGYNG